MNDRRNEQAMAPCNEEVRVRRKNERKRKQVGEEDVSIEEAVTMRREGERRNR